MRLEWHYTKDDGGAMHLYGITVTREPGDKRPSNESHFFYKLKQWIYELDPLNRGRWIKLNYVPGLNSIPYSLRLGTKNKPEGFLYDNNYALRDTAKTFWETGSVYLSFWDSQALPVAVRKEAVNG